MGCGASIKVHPVNFPSVNLTDLPAELIFKIYDEIDTLTLYQSVYCLSKFFLNTVSNYNRHHLDLKSISLKSFQTICLRVDPKNITQLTLTNEESTTGLLEKFLDKLPIERFTRLQTLILSNIDDEELINRILLTINDDSSHPRLSSIKINEPNENYDELFETIISNILTKSSLRKLNLTLSDRRTSTSPIQFPENCSINRLSLGNTCSIEFLRQIFTRVNSLKSLEMDDLDFDNETNLNEEETIDNIDGNDDDDDNSTDTDSIIENDYGQQQEEHEPVPIEVDDQHQVNNEIGDILDDDEELVEISPPEKERFTSIGTTTNLKSLTINRISVNMCKIEWFIAELSGLRHLDISTITGYDDKYILDGLRWCNLTQKLNTFKFVFTLTLDENSAWKPEECLRQYQTDFWINEKSWFVALENCQEDVSLYTLPYSRNNYVMKSRLNQYEYRTTALPHQFTTNQTMKSVTTLYLNMTDFTSKSPQNYQGPKFEHINQLWLYNTWSRTGSLVDQISSFVDLSVVEEFYRDEPLPTVELMNIIRRMKNLKSIKTTTDLLDGLNAAKFSCNQCIRSINVETASYDRQRGINFEPFCTMFPRVQYLSIPVDSVEACQYIIDELKSDLIKVNFQILVDNEDEESYNENDRANDPFSEWLAELPREFKHFRKLQSIHVWLQ